MPRISQLPPDDPNINDSDLVPLVETPGLDTKKQTMGHVKGYITSGLGDVLPYNSGDDL